MIFTQGGPMDAANWNEDTGERRVRKPTSVVRRGAGGKGPRKWYLACCLPYFVCFCESRQDAEQVQKILVEWLKERGLTLSEEKTRIVHLTEGLDFLGFNIRHYPAPQTSRTGWKLLIKPSKESIQDVQMKLKELWRKVQGTNARTVVGQLNPVIRGWANYFRTAVAKEIFSGLDRWMFYKADRHARRKHPKKS